MTQTAEEYLGAFLDGFEFLLLAAEGRLDGETDPDVVEAFLEDYQRILELHRRHLEAGGDREAEEALEGFPSAIGDGTMN